MTENHDNTGASPLTERLAGFTLVEIVIAIAIVAILSAITIPVYNGYIDRAKIALGVSTLNNARKLFEDYHIDFQSYPLTMNFASGEDGSGKKVFPAEYLSEFGKNLSSVVSYTATATDFNLTVTANDSKLTPLILTPNQVVVQGP